MHGIPVENQGGSDQMSADVYGSLVKSRISSSIYEAMVKETDNRIEKLPVEGSKAVTTVQRYLR